MRTDSWGTNTLSMCAYKRHNEGVEKSAQIACAAKCGGSKTIPDGEIVDPWAFYAVVFVFVHLINSDRDNSTASTVELRPRPVRAVAPAANG